VGVGSDLAVDCRKGPDLAVGYRGGSNVCVGSRNVVGVGESRDLRGVVVLPNFKSECTFCWGNGTGAGMFRGSRQVPRPACCSATSDRKLARVFSARTFSAFTVVFSDTDLVLAFSSTLIILAYHSWGVFLVR
jgi:hypothetical protein